MILEWTKVNPLPGVQLQWLGPQYFTEDWLERTVVDIEAFSSLAQLAGKVAVISGPRGEKGEKGEKGEDGLMTLPDVLDGGNF